VFAIFEAKKGALVITNEGEDSRFEEDLSSDVLTVFAVFRPRLYGSYTQQCREPIDGVRTTLMAARCS
jgi:predicted site-specific integrase-resolvase